MDENFKNGKTNDLLIKENFRNKRTEDYYNNEILRIYIEFRVDE